MGVFPQVPATSFLHPQLLGAVLEGLFSEMSYLFQAVRHLCSLSWELLSSMGAPKMG